MRVRPAPLRLALCLLAFAGTVQAAEPQWLNPAGAGRRAFLKPNSCGCHGMYAGCGIGPGIAHRERGDVAEAVMQGNEGGMPSHRRVATATDIRNLTADLMTIGTASEPKFKDWWIDVPPK